jgi:glycosyltransferase involved in cell wall biosynthesis
MSTQRVIAFLGRKDEPTDAVEEYCRYLGAALAPHNIQLEIHRFPWEKIGWPEAFEQLKNSTPAWRDHWVLVQYTALAWSAHGFPSKFLNVLRLLKSAGVRVAIVFHDVDGFPGAGIIDRIRRTVQIRTMRRALSLADSAIFPVALQQLSWLPPTASKAKFIPVGPNLPIPTTAIPAVSNSVPTIGIFSITGGEPGARETNLIIPAVASASEKLGTVRLSVFGRHAEVRERDLRVGLQKYPVQLSVEGVVDPDQVVQKLSLCDLLLFVRGGISSRRSSAIAGIACGLPVIALAGSETAAPVTKAGVILIPQADPRLLAAALVRVLSDSAFRAELASRSRAAYQEHFSWPAIAAKFAAFLNS